MTGFPKGTRLKADKDLHRNRFTVMLTDDQRKDLYKISQEWDDLFSVVFRKCFQIVCMMDEQERKKAFWALEELKTS